MPEAGLLAWRCADVGGRICGWALLGMALRPVDASRTPVSIGARLKEETAMSLQIVSQPPPQARHPAALVASLDSGGHRGVGGDPQAGPPKGLGRFEATPGHAGAPAQRRHDPLGLLPVPWLQSSSNERMEKPTMMPMPSCGLRQALLQRQLRLQRMLLLGRNLTTIAAAAVVAAKYGSTAPDGTCLAGQNYIVARSTAERPDPTSA